MDKRIGGGVMVLIAQIALGVIIGGLTLALLFTGFIMWMQDPKKEQFGR